MPDSTISAFPAGTPTSGSVMVLDNAAGSATFSCTVSALLSLLTNAGQLTTGTLPAAQLPASGVTAGTYTSVTVDVYGRVTAGTSPAVAYGSLSGIPSTFTPAAHNQAWGTITGTPTTVAGYGITDGVVTSDSRLTNARAPTAHGPTHQTGQAGAIDPVVLTLALTGTYNALDISAADLVRITCTGNVTINGFLATGNPDGAPKFIVNETAAGGGTITIAHESASASALDRVYSQSGAAVVLPPDGGQSFVHRSSAKSRWRV